MNYTITRLIIIKANCIREKIYKEKIYFSREKLISNLKRGFLENIFISLKISQRSLLTKIHELNSYI